MNFNFLNPWSKPHITSNETKPPSQDQDQNQVKNNNLEKKVNQTIQDKLPPQPEPNKTNDGWRIWSMLGFGKKEEVSVEEKKRDSLPNEDLNSDESYDSDDSDDFVFEGDEHSPYEESAGIPLDNSDLKSVEKEKKQDIEILEKPLIQNAPPLEINKREKLERIAYKAAEKSVAGKMWTGFTGAVGNTLLWMGKKTGVIQNYLGTYDLDKEKAISRDKKKMHDALNDPQFVQFYEAISTALIPTIKQKVLDNVSQGKGTSAELIASQEGLILKLLEVILARGFANLACNVKENAENIPNFDNQPSLVSVMSLLSHKAGQHINHERLKELENNYREDQANLTHLIGEVFPEIKDQPDSQAALQLYIKEYLHWKTDKSRQSTIKKDLFPNLDSIGGKKAKDIQAFFTTLDSLHRKSHEMHHLFTQVSEDVLLCLFPNKFDDLPEFKGWGLSAATFFKYDFNFLRNIVADLMQDSYEPLENDLVRNESLEQDLITRLGTPDLNPVVQAPSTLLVAFAKNYIQSDPSVVQTTARLIDGVFWYGQVSSVTNPIKVRLQQMEEELKELIRQDKDLIEERINDDIALIKALDAEMTKFEQGILDLNALEEKRMALQKLQTPSARTHLNLLNQDMEQLITLGKNLIEKRNDILDQLSQQQLAGWVVESVQSMLNTEDPNLAGLGQFVKQVLNNLTLALMTKGAKLMFPEGEKVEPNAFIKEFSERLIEKAGALQGEEVVSEKFWTEFVNDLPLPPLVKNMLVPIIIEKAKSLQDTFKEASPDIQDIQKVYEEALQKIKSYEGGEQLFAITETISDQIIGKVLEQNVGLVSTLGFGDTVEELFAQYLPGITFNEDLKNWFKGNISALGITEEGQSPQSIVLLKQGIQAIMLKAMVNTIETNFQNNSKDYAAQLLKNFHTAFSKAFTGFNEVQRKQLDEALNIQSDINKKNEQLKAIKEQAAKKPSGITDEQTLLLDEVIAANTRYIRASNYVGNLEEKREKILTSLNQISKKKKAWTADNLLAVNEALVLRKTELPLYPTEEEYLSKVRDRIYDLNVKKDTGIMDPDGKELEQLKQLKLLLALMEMSPDALKQLSEAAHIQTTLLHAKNELEHLNKGLKGKEEAIAQYEKTGKIQNQREWTAAKKWLGDVLTGKKDRHQIYRDITQLEQELDAHLGAFKVLSKELTALLGLDNKEKLDLPLFLQDKFWPYIESAQEKQIPRLLFTQVAPLLISVIDVENNRKELQELSNGNPFLGQLIQAASKDIMSQVFDVIKPEEIAAAINNAIPGATDLHSLIAPQLQAVITGQDQTFKENREILQQFLEGTILRLFVKIAKANQSLTGEDPLTILTGKLKDLAMKAVPQDGQTPEEAARQMIDQVLGDVLDIKSQEDFDNIPAALQQLVYDKVKEQAYQQLTPFVLPIIERNQSRAILENKSGSDFLGSLCEALSKDIFTFIPDAINNYHAVSKELLTLLSGDKNPTDEEVMHMEASFSLMLTELGKNGAAASMLKPLVKGLVPEAREDALSQSIAELIPQWDEKRPPQEEILNLLKKEVQTATPEERQNLEKKAKILTKSISQLLFKRGKATLEPKHLVQAYNNQVTGRQTKMVGAQIQKFENDLQQKEIMKKIKAILITPEEIVSAIGEFFPHVDDDLQRTLADEIQKMIHGGSEAYLNASSFVGAYIEGVLLKVFIGVAEKNPKQISQDPSVPLKDSMIVLTEKLLDITTKKYQEAKGGKDFKVVAQELNNAIMKDILGIDSSAAFKGLPEGLQTKAYDAIKDQLGGMLVRIQESLSSLDSSNQQVIATKETVKKFGIAENATKAYAQILSEDIANMVVVSVPHVLSEIAGENMKGVVSISKGVEKFLEDLARGNVQMAKILLGYAQGEQFKKILGDNIGKLAKEDAFIDDKRKAADLLGNLLLEPIGTALERAVNFEEKHKKQFNQKLMANLLHVAAEHLKHLNDAKTRAGEEGRKDITHEDFVNVMGEELHPGVPTAPITYQESINVITETLTLDQKNVLLAKQDDVRDLIAKMVEKEAKAEKVMSLDDFVKDFDVILGNSLTPLQKTALKAPNKDGFTLRDIIRKEAEAPSRQRQEFAYGPATEAILKMIFPNGQKDMTFVPEELRETVWNLFKNNLFPIVLPMLTEVILDPSTINTMVLSSLQSARDNLSGKIVLSTEPPEPKDLALDELDKASGELIAETLKATTLPDWAKKMLIDPNTGEISDSMKKTLGATLRQQFNDTFIKDKLKITLESAVKRDKQGKPTLSFDTRPTEVKKAEAAKKSQQMEKDLKAASREIITVSISYFIRSKWAAAHAQFEKILEKRLGKVGVDIKHALDRVFGFVFFTCIGTLFSPFTRLVKHGIQELVAWLFSLDESRKSLLELFTKVPTDQPEADLKQHAVLHEDLVFKMGEALSKTVEEFLEKEPIIPMVGENPNVA